MTPPIKIISIKHKMSGNRNAINLKRIMVIQIKIIKIKPSCKNCTISPYNKRWWRILMQKS